ncbi:membrane protein [Microbacterium terrae]|uniref:Membrane protein YczE n=1 Tax=Microbacterium terrae TaxID=69369 RepID=A0A0M2H3D9_9MICO|nr:membrane protein [Microbacterium terrae]KJL38865.1 hypothetical protein RS81_02272 [Microbacterium terrae]GLJ99788.1 membrane protein [Microbacterium terrae]
MTRRVTQLLIGLVLYGVGCGLTVAAGLGVDPWTVLAQGVSLRTGVGIGWVTNIIGFLVLLLWIPLHQRPGIGTVLNILLVGTSMQALLWLLPPVSGFALQAVTLLGGILLVAVASGLYIGARFGPGPRDGLMTGLHSRFGWPIWACRAAVELSVLFAGWMLGGTVGIGTVLFAVLIGPLVHVTLPLLDTRRGSGAETPPAPSGTSIQKETAQTTRRPAR